MTHDQLVRRVAKRENVSIRDAGRIVRGLGEEVAAALARGESATIYRVGTLRPARSENGRTTFRSSEATWAAQALVADHLEQEQA
jgi:nucleoid DNA-binding protein